MNKRSQKKTLLCLASITGAVSISLAVATTVAAFINVSRNNISADYKTESIGSTYFGGGTGASDDPYLISSADNLRNLQKLNTVGLFPSGTYFDLNSDITWSGDALLPIGSDDYPFDGIFNGRGHVITDLVVDGANTWDVGMFGYIGINGILKNMLLATPTINVKNQDGGGTSSTTNALSSLDTAAAALPEISTTSGTSGAISWSNGTNSATITGFPTSLTSSGVTYPITWVSSNPTLLNASTFVTAENSASESKDKDLYPVHVSGYVQAIIDGKLVRHVVERYQFNILGNGTIPTTTTKVTYNSVDYTVSNSAFKTIWRTFTSGDNTYDDTHGLYAGFFVGHLDGATSYLGLYGGTSSGTSNAKIVLNNRETYSSSVLVGRTREDNSIDSSAGNKYHTYLDFSGKSFSNYTAPKEPSAGTMYSSASDFTTQMSNANSLTNSFLNSTAATYTKVFPSVSKATNLSYVDEDGASHTGQALTLNKALSAGAKGVQSSETFLVNHAVIDNYFVNNGIWIWSTSKSSDRVSTILGSNIFSITIRLTYVATTTNANHEQNAFQILFNSYNPDITKSLLWWSSPESALQSVKWYDLHHPFNFISSSAPTASTSQYTPVAIRDDGVEHTDEITITVDKSSGFWSALVTSWLLSDTWYPCFAIGMGKNEEPASGSDEIITHNLTSTSLTYSTTSGQQWSNPSSGTVYYANSYFNLNGDCNLNILGLDVIFTNREGNVTSLMNYVDYVPSNSYSYNTTNDDLADNWPDDSSVKLKINMNTITPASTNPTYGFYRNGTTVYYTSTDDNYISYEPTDNGYKVPTKA